MDLCRLFNYLYDDAGSEILVYDTWDLRTITGGRLAPVYGTKASGSKSLNKLPDPADLDSLYLCYTLPKT
jgi:hypothetical protein